MEKIYIDNYLSNLPRYLADKNSTVVVYCDNTCVLYGADTLNEQYCKSKGITMYHTHNFGGTIVNFNGDICVGNYQSKFNNFGLEFLTQFVSWLQGKGLKATVVQNDVLIDGTYKVASYMSQYINGCLYTAIHLSVNMDITLIENICTKPMNKIPKGLTEYGITAKDVDNFVLSVIK